MTPPGSGHRLAEILPMDLADKQFCLELDDPLRRLDVLAPLIEITAQSDTGH
jgi:Lon protease-like protein